VARFIAYDTETTGLTSNPDARMFTFSECDWNGNSSAHRIWDHDGTFREKAMQRLKWLWADEQSDVGKVMHNARFDVTMTERLLKRSLRGHRIHDTMALSHLFQNTHQTHGLDTLGWELFGFPKAQDDPTARYLDSERGLLDCPDWVLRPYQLADAERTMMLFRLWYPKLRTMGFLSEYEMECDLVWTTKAIEERGMMISTRKCRALRDECLAKRDAALEDFYTLTRDRHKPTDGMLRHILYDKLNLPVIRKTKNARIPAVDATTLKELEEKTKHPIFDIILRIRAYAKGATDVESYMTHADSNGIIHPSIHPYGADTGRETCKRPNLQNVAKDTTMKARYAIRARSCFRPKPGFVNFHVDYSGIEARLAVNASRDAELIEMMRTNADMHSTAAEIFYKEVWTAAQDDPRERKRLRDAAKNGNFSMIYGAAPPKVAATLQLPLEVLLPRYREYKARFPGLISLAQRTIAQARRDNYITTAFGRRLYVPEAHAALNYLIQGEAASVLKRAQNRVHAYLESATGGEAGICLPIHDELVIEWPRARLREAPGCLREIKHLMIDFPQFDVPLDVECKRSTADWSRPTKIKIPE